MSRRLAPLVLNPSQRPKRKRCYWDFSKHGSEFRRVVMHTNTTHVSRHVFIFLIHYFKILAYHMINPCAIFQGKASFLWLFSISSWFKVCVPMVTKREKFTHLHFKECFQLQNMLAFDQVCWSLEGMMKPRPVRSFYLAKDSQVTRNL